MTVYLYRETISHILSLKYHPLSFQHGNPRYQGLIFPNIGHEQTITKIGFFSKNLSQDSLSIMGIIPYLENMQLDTGYVTPVISIINGKYGGLISNGCIYSLWEGIRQEGVKL